MRLVIMPQTLKRMLPALAGQFISTIEDSAIVAAMSIQELTCRIALAAAKLFSPLARLFQRWAGRKRAMTPSTSVPSSAALESGRYWAVALDSEAEAPTSMRPVHSTRFSQKMLPSTL